MKPTVQSYDCVDEPQGKYHKNAVCEQQREFTDRHAEHLDDVSSQFFFASSAKLCKSKQDGYN